MSQYAFLYRKNRYETRCLLGIIAYFCNVQTPTGRQSFAFSHAMPVRGMPSSKFIDNDEPTNNRNHIMDLSRLYDIFIQHPTITTDSRNCPSGSIFFALKGASFDGNRFAAKALEQGCAYAVIDDQTFFDAADGRFILVDDCLKALQDLAHEHRKRLGTKVVGITGTNGKTTTKELMAAVLSKKYKVLFTEGNFNNHIGVPKTLLRLNAGHDIAVIEMGANHPGEIATLAAIADPDYGIITNVGKAHLEGFGSFEGVIRTKGELYDHLRRKTNGTVFVQSRNKYLNAMTDGLNVVRYGTADEPQSMVVGKVLGVSPLLHFSWRTDTVPEQPVQTHLIGGYNIDNLLAAVCIGRYFDVSPSDINDALETYVPSNNRSQYEVTAHNKLIIDTYNANPTSMEAALQNFKEMAAEHKMVILGEMRELGLATVEEHQRIAAFLQQAGFEKVWLVGEAFASVEGDFRKFADVEAVKATLAAEQPQGFHILIKGSNGTHLYELPPLL